MNTQMHGAHQIKKLNRTCLMYIVKKKKLIRQKSFKFQLKYLCVSKMNETLMDLEQHEGQ